MNYSLDKLPDGYALLERPRIVNPDIVSFDYRWARVMPQLLIFPWYSMIGSFTAIRLGSISNRRFSSSPISTI